MTAVIRKGIGDIRRRRLQTSVIAMVALLSALAATLALNLLVESDAPYAHAFSQANGPHLVVTFGAAKASVGQLAATVNAMGVTQAVGPWPVAETGLAFSTQASPDGGGKSPGATDGGRAFSIVAVLVGRDRPDTEVDSLTIATGRWAHSPGEIVLSLRLAIGVQVRVGDLVTATDAPGMPTLTVVGVAASISPYADAWVAPSEVASLVAPDKAAGWAMEYRVSDPSSAATLAHAVDRISELLPAGSVLKSLSWLDVKKRADLTAAVMVPFLVAFSAFALLAAMFVISNVVAGVVIADRRQIGIMKSVGFTPLQVSGVLVIQVLAPALIGCAIGIPLGTLASQPFLQQTAQALGLPAPFSASIPVDIGVLALVLIVVLAASAWPAARAGRLSAAIAISRGTGPSRARGGRLITYLSDLPLAAPIRLGLAELAGRPLRSAMTGLAVLIGVATVVFAIGLHLSLTMVAARLIRDQEVQVGVNVSPGQTSQQVAGLLQNASATAKFVAEGQEQIRIPGMGTPVPYYGYDGDSSWLGYAMITGHWFNAPGEVVAPSHLMDVAGLSVGQTFAATVNGQPVQLKLVGEVFDQAGDNMLLRGVWSTIAAFDPHAATDHFEVQVRPGTDPQQYAANLQAGTGTPLDVFTVGNSGTKTAFILIDGVVAGLALVLTAIAVAGVLNTVVLGTRERRREIAILKAFGMSPNQVVVMVVSAVAVVGLLAGVLGVPAGVALHHQILSSMGEIATNTRIPAAIYNVLGILPVIGLGSAGTLTAVIGAWFPAQWAARELVTQALKAE